MRKFGLILVAGVALAQSPAPYQRVGTMSQLMINIIFPTSDAVFYVDRNEPKTEVEWNNLANQALMLAESGNLLIMPGRQRDEGNWIKFSKMMINAGNAAFKAANARDMDGVRAVNEELYQSCVECHTQYRRDYPKRPAAEPSR